jgi:hypothetical protein
MLYDMVNQFVFGIIDIADFDGNYLWFFVYI